MFGPATLHFMERAEERFGWKLSLAEVNAILNRILSGWALEVQDGGRLGAKTYSVEVRGVWTLVVCKPAAGQLITIIRPEGCIASTPRKAIVKNFKPHPNGRLSRLRSRQARGREE